MRKLIIFASIALYSATSYGAGLKYGVHGGHTTDGDLIEKDIAFGGHVVLQINDYLSTEFDVTTYDDKDIRTDALTLSIRLQTPMVYNTYFYGFAGIGNFVFRSDFEEEPMTISQELGGATRSVESALKLEEEIGTIYGIGLAYQFHYTFELFIDYRFTTVEIPGKTTTTVTLSAPETDDVVTITEVDNLREFDHGLVRFGVNLSF